LNLREIIPSLDFIEINDLSVLIVFEMANEDRELVVVDFVSNEDLHIDLNRRS
jgi:hypothetical protein